MTIKESIRAKKLKEQDDINNALEYINYFIRDCLPDIIKENTPKSFEAFKNFIVSGRKPRYNESYIIKRSFSPKWFLKKYAEATIKVWFGSDLEWSGGRRNEILQYYATVRMLSDKKCRGFNHYYDSLEGYVYYIVVTPDITLREGEATRLGPRLKAIFYEEAVKCAKKDDFVLKQDKNGLIKVRYYY